MERGQAVGTTSDFDFDMEKYLRHSRRLVVEDLPWDSVREHPLSEAEVRFLKYMMNIESHTVLYLRDLLSTTAIEEEDVVAFLTMWNYEEFWHGHYLEKFTRAYIGDGDKLQEHDRRVSWSTKGFVNAVKGMLTPVITKASPDFAATHMTWGAMQEYTTLHAYESVARQSKHPMLREILTRIVRDERRHFAFYFEQAKKRLDRSPFMQRETRFFMDKLWRPVGANVMPDSELDFVAWYLFRDAESFADVRKVDAVMARLPGMEGWVGLTREVERSIARQLKIGPNEPWLATRAPGEPSRVLVQAV